jgi:DNA-binding GntR family transcriptional regulator
MASETLTSKAYRHLYGEIVDGRIAAGAVISESAIAKSLGISRTPVGEAVRLLARDGLVDQVPRFGTVVRHVQRTELDEHYEMREALESYAAQLAARRATTADRECKKTSVKNRHRPL